MTALTVEAIEDYINYSSEVQVEIPEGWIPSPEVVKAIDASPIPKTAQRVFLTAAAIGADPYMSLWISAFQLGREFESRRIELEGIEPKVPA